MFQPAMSYLPQSHSLVLLLLLNLYSVIRQTFGSCIHWLVVVSLFPVVTSPVIQGSIHTRLK